MRSTVGRSQKQGNSRLGVVWRHTTSLRLLQSACSLSWGRASARSFRTHYIHAKRKAPFHRGGWLTGICEPVLVGSATTQNHLAEDVKNPDQGNLVSISRSIRPLSRYRKVIGGGIYGRNLDEEKIPNQKVARRRVSAIETEAQWYYLPARYRLAGKTGIKQRKSPA